MRRGLALGGTVVVVAAFVGVVVVNTGPEYRGRDDVAVLMFPFVAVVVVMVVLGFGLVNIRRLFGLAPHRRWRVGVRTHLVRQSPGWLELGEDRRLSWRPDDGAGGWSVEVTRATVRRWGISSVEVVAGDGRTFILEVNGRYHLSPLSERWFYQRSGQQARQLVDAVRGARAVAS